MQLLQRLVKKYDAATVFVFAATVVVIIELSLMRILVPASASAQQIEGQFLMEQICTSSSLRDSSEEVDGWSQQTQRLSQRLSSSPQLWQKELVSFHAFSDTEIETEEVFTASDSRKQYHAAADYAADQLTLTSVMSGRKMLANINGRIYQEGDTISLRGGEIVISIIELNSTSAVIQLTDFDVNGDTTRTIYLANSSRLANGVRTP